MIIVLISWNNYLIMKNRTSISYCYSDLSSSTAHVKRAENFPTTLTDTEVDRIIEMAWEDRTSFDAIKFQFGLNEAAVKTLMKKELKFSSYKLWRNRVENCKTKHSSKRTSGIDRFKCNLQRSISNNKVSKR